MPTRAIYLETFGCQMNELDSELVAGRLGSLGYRFVERPDEADIVLYNTCSVRDRAEQKVRSRLGEMARRKQAEPGLVVGVLGCMAERDGEDLMRRMPVVDVLCGPGELDQLPMLLDNAARTKPAMLAPEDGRHGSLSQWHERLARVDAEHERTHKSETCATNGKPDRGRTVALQGNSSRRTATLAAAEDRLELLDLSRSVSPTDHNGSAYVRITRGCNKFCTYCVVPHTRGAEIHRPPDHIVDECKRLADAGVIEVTLLGQTVNHYRYEHGAATVIGGVEQPQKGRSFKGGHRRDPVGNEPVGRASRPSSVDRVTTFADLLKRIHDEVPAIKRLRFVTSYPRDFTDDALAVMRESPRICRYLHVPAQSGSDAMLRRMNRGYSVEQYIEFIDRAREYLHQPEIGRPLMIAGDMIVGFPGETEEDFQASVRLLQRVRYKNCFIFKYSPRPGTVAQKRLTDDVPEQVKRRRNNELLAVQHRISDEIAQAQRGETLDVFVEGLSAREKKRRSHQWDGRPAPQDGRAKKPRNNGAPAPVALTISGEPACPQAGHDRAGDSPARAVLGGHSLSQSKDARLGEPGHQPDQAPQPPQLTGRTDGDLVVLFDTPAGTAPDDWIGRVVPVRIDSANTVTLFGRVAE